MASRLNDAPSGASIEASTPRRFLTPPVHGNGKAEGGVTAAIAAKTERKKSV
jgi:hypothetical protein